MRKKTDAFLKCLKGFLWDHEQLQDLSKMKELRISNPRAMRCHKWNHYIRENPMSLEMFKQRSNYQIPGLL